ncbi:hypothetical protein EMPG_16988 [Blastomyces silverae]|uniref:Uncharacterized protein n=1 Tax=Blastomyces silverae TaxID=2060906 RepID=A0A0H1B817_9EURO|nr:hypothetical protein EMPG_16988 [Blastomyces silverae]
MENDNKQAVRRGRGNRKDGSERHIQLVTAGLSPLSLLRALKRMLMLMTLELKRSAGKAEQLNYSRPDNRCGQLFPISQSLFASCHTARRLPGGRELELVEALPVCCLQCLMSALKVCSVSNTARLGQTGRFFRIEPLLEKGKSVILVQGLTQINYTAKSEKSKSSRKCGPGPGLSHGSDPPVNPNSSHRSPLGQERRTFVEPHAALGNP